MKITSLYYLEEMIEHILKKQISSTFIIMYKNENQYTTIYKALNNYNTLYIVLIYDDYINISIHYIGVSMAIFKSVYEHILTLFVSSTSYLYSLEYKYLYDIININGLYINGMTSKYPLIMHTTYTNKIKSVCTTLYNKCDDLCHIKYDANIFVTYDDELRIPAKYKNNHKKYFKLVKKEKIENTIYDENDDNYFSNTNIHQYQKGGDNSVQYQSVTLTNNDFINLNKEDLDDFSDNVTRLLGEPMRLDE